MKIYTKTGDKGLTSLVDGRRVEKYNIRIKAYGTVDELNSYMGLIRAQEISEEIKKDIAKIQNNLFVIGSILATENPEKIGLKKITKEQIKELEQAIDRNAENLPSLKKFIIPGGNTVISFCHIARCVCRRAERISLELNVREEIDEKLLIYLNRLSDYLFILARKLGTDMNVKEITWDL